MGEIAHIRDRYTISIHKWSELLFLKLVTSFILDTHTISLFILNSFIFLIIRCPYFFYIWTGGKLSVQDWEKWPIRISGFHEKVSINLMNLPTFKNPSVIYKFINMQLGWNVDKILFKIQSIIRLFLTF